MSTKQAKRLHNSIRSSVNTNTTEEWGFGRGRLSKLSSRSVSSHDTSHISASVSLETGDFTRKVTPRVSFSDGPYRTNPDDHAESVENVSAVAYHFHHKDDPVGRKSTEDSEAARLGNDPEQRAANLAAMLQAEAKPFGCTRFGRTLQQGRQYMKRLQVPNVKGLLRRSPKDDAQSFGVPVAPQPDMRASSQLERQEPGRQGSKPRVTWHDISTPLLSEDEEVASSKEGDFVRQTTPQSQGDFMRQTTQQSHSSFARQITQESTKEIDEVLNEGSDFTWLCVFPLPMTTTLEDQRKFENLLYHEHRSHIDVLEDAFGTFMAKNAVKGALSATLAYSNEEAEESWMELISSRKSRQVSMLDLSIPRISLLSSMTHMRRKTKVDLTKEDVEQFTLTKARQCTIELMLAYYHTFRKSAEDYFKSQSEKELRRNQYHNCRSKQHIRVFKFTSEDKESLYVCSRMSVHVAELHAEIEQYPLQLSKAGLVELEVKLSDPNTSPAYVKFERKFRKLFQMHEDAYDAGENSVLRQKDRIRILYDKLTESLNLNQLESVGLVRHSFPLHHEKSVAALGKSWGTLRLLLSLRQPLEDIRNYFGEEIAFYFLFLHELVRASLVLTVPALLLYYWQMTTGKGYARPALALIILVWYRVFTKRWQRTEALFSNQWGGDVHEASTIKKLRNPRFKGKMMPAPDDEHLMRAQVPRSTELIGRTCSFFLSFAFVIALLLVVALEHYLMFICTNDASRTVWDKAMSMSVGGLFGMQIRVVDLIWDRLSDRITDLEHRYYEEDFDWSKRVKASFVKFVTSVITVIFSAFAQPALEIHYHTSEQSSEGDFGTRRSEAQIEHQRIMLEHQLFSIFFTRYLVLYGAINDVVTPWIKFVREKQRDVSYLEDQAEMTSYGNYELTNDYLDALLPLGFVTFFGMIYPPSVLLLLLVLLIRIRADAWKLLYVYRRPYPHVAKDLGVFNSMLGLFAYGMVLTNLGLVMVDFGGIAQLFNLKFDPMFLTIYGFQVRTIWFLDALIFLAAALAISLCWHLLEFILDDSSHFVRTERQRQDLQRHILSYTGFKGVDLRRVQLTPDRLVTRPDFSRVQTYKEATRHRLSTSLSRAVSRANLDEII